jgi:hypothetical protein
MLSKIQSQLALGVATVLSIGSFSIFPAAAQETRTIVQNLSENQGYIRGCRQLNQQAEVFDNTNLSPSANRIGTLAAGTQVRLTGVLAPGRAQIFLAGGTLSTLQPVGWVNAATLTTCGATPPPPVTRACFRANFGLNVRAAASSNSALLGNYLTGDTVIATSNPPTQQTSPNSPPDYRRVWMAVTMPNGNAGWVATTGTYGQGSNVTSIPCP